MKIDGVKILNDLTTLVDIGGGFNKIEDEEIILNRINWLYCMNFLGLFFG